MATTPRHWQFDLAHSGISFWVRHLLVSKVRGSFTRWSGTLVFDEARPEAAQLSVEIDAASVDTHEAKRDEHLRSPDFLDVAAYPKLTYHSTRVEPAGDRRYQVHGTLTLHGVSRPVTLDVEYAGDIKDPWGHQRAGFSARATIDRKEFGINFNQVLDAGGLALGDKVEIAIEVEAVAAAAQAA
jgi:polyisoprenoid-binding protein YceI